MTANHESAEASTILNAEQACAECQRKDYWLEQVRAVLMGEGTTEEALEKLERAEESMKVALAGRAGA
uniref:hypothetical protein n=1 Tax=Streptomyces sp. W9 TaxID=682410 RepID=UPI00186856C0|nr:hypothetical protein [Streptomyces sp. W9]